jgi:hypothetical protein
MAARAYLIASQPMPAPARGQESVRAKAATGVTFNLDPAGA